jgi:hypothetical protein
LLVPLSPAQNTVSGDLTGVVTDPSGAVLPNVQVNLTNNSSGQKSTSTTNAQGVYRFPLLNPGSYTVSAVAQGFQTVQHAAIVTVGQATTVNVQLALSSANTTVEVTAEGGLVQTQNGNISTTFTPSQIEATPNPGNDLSYIVQQAPGAVMNTQAGYGNSAIFGLPATSNLYTVNGMNENDPFLNLNNSGATNLLLGQNDVQEVTVVNNGYSGQYGSLAGANVNYVSKAGTNQYHGNADYFWNGSALNANSWFNNNAGVARPFVNANQWAASFGGPIKKNSTFFFVNTEGLRVVIPTSTAVNIPSPQFEAATLANLTATNLASVPFYQNMFNLWNSAPGATGAANVLGPGTDPATGALTGNGCAGLSATIYAALPAGSPCALQFRSTAGNFTHEWLLTTRIDQNIGNNDRLFGHFRTDHGFQATYTDPLNSAFNAGSTQPQYEGQLNETHTFNSSMVNQLVLSGQWYSALFGPANLSAATSLMPYRLGFSGGSFYPLGDELNDWPQGRNVTQYQAVDDFSIVRGRHNLKFGVNFRRNDITDYSPGFFTTGYNTGEGLSQFYSGTGATYIQNFATRLTEPIALYDLGLYGQDEFSLTHNLRITLSLRAEHYSNPVCQTNCFARLTGDFFGVSHDPNQPYNQAIQTGLHQALPAYTNIAWQPRFGFAWSPFGSANTVIRGGIGIFNDAFPGTVADNFLNNPPLTNQFVVSGAALSPAVAGNNIATASAANAAFVNGFSSGGTLSSISLADPLFFPPSFYNSAHYIHAPQYQEWNLEFQQGLGQKMSLNLNYVGNHGIWGGVQNAGLNAFCDPTVCGGAGFLNNGTGFSGLPTASPDARFGTVTEIMSQGVSNYNGLTVSLQRRFSSVQFQANYTWSHALDDISNAGFLPYNFDTNESILNPINPYNLRQLNYGNSDYDTRHYFSLNYVWNTPKLSNKWVRAIEDWTVSGTLFTRSGLPFSVFDSAATGNLEAFNYGVIGGDSILANNLTGGPISCSRSAVSTPCFTTAQFSPVTTGYGLQRRNQIYGPMFFDTDLTLMKNFHVPINETSTFGIGAQFFNLFNHPNFDQPVGDVESGSFGSILNTVSVPTSIVGSFLGADASPRFVQIKATLNF